MSSLLEKNSSSNTLIIGSIIQGRYQVLSKLKGGALSRTYLVQDLSQPNEPKCVLKHYPYNKEIPRLYKTNMRLFLKEAKHLQVLSVHPQIPRLIDYFGITDQGWYLVQELIEGKLLNNALPMSEYSENYWSVYEVARFIHDICETLQFVHSQKIIHCDLKPNNIISRASDDRLVIIDFGSAQYIPGFQTNEDSSITSLRTKITVSPSGYLAPEQTNGQPQPCSDFYALGVMAIQAWTGLDPARMKKDSHTGELVWDQYVKIDEPEACRRLVNIISRMVQPDIGDRFRHARDLLEELDAFLHTFDDQQDVPIDYGNISFDDATLFQKPDMPLGESTKAPTQTPTQVPTPKTAALPAQSEDEVSLPPVAAKETYIQGSDDEGFYKQTFVQSDEELLEFDERLLSEFEQEELSESAIADDNEDEETSDLDANDLPLQLKRRTSKKTKLPMLALISISVVIINGLLIAFGLQHLIKNMATADTPQPDNDFQRAQAAYAQGDLPEAIAIAQAIPQQNPGYEEAQANLSQWEQELQNQAQKLAAITAAYDAQNWQEVVSQGSSLKDPELRQQVAQQIEAAQFEIDVAAYQRVQKAFDLAADYDFNQAIATLAEAPPNSKFANVITDKLTEYEGKKVVRNQFYLQQAVNHAEAREFGEAVAFLEKIPADSTHHELAEVKIVEYSEKQEIREAYERWAAAKAQQDNSPKATRFVKNSPMATEAKLQSAQMLSQVNPGMLLRGIA